METLQLLTQSFAMACALGPLIGLMALVAYKALERVGRGGFTATFHVPGTKDGRYDR